MSKWGDKKNSGGGDGIDHGWCHSDSQDFEDETNNNVGCLQAIAKRQVIGGSWSSAKLPIMQNYSDKANKEVSLTAENAWQF